MLTLAIKAFLFLFGSADAPEQLAWSLATTAAKAAHYAASIL